MNNKFFSLLIAAVMLSAISCSRNEETAAPDAAGEEVIVTLSVATEDKMVSSRAISDGSGADMLVYAVYTPEYENGEIKSYHLLEQYGQGVTDETLIAEGIESGAGQSVLFTGDKLLSDDGETISLRLMRGKTYYFAFWAQNHKCKAYDTKDLEKVVVNYEGAKNNDELRDAFTTSYTFQALPDTKVKVVLTRALAQINVGTAGWDYNNEVGAGWGPYVYSKIVVDGAYRAMNAVTQKVLTENDGIENARTSVTYDWARIPAYLNAADFPENASTEELRAYLVNEKNDTEFLRVKLTSEEPTDQTAAYYDDKNYLKYLTTRPASSSYNVNGVYTEVFKYLSMCYVLVPANNSVLSDNVSATSLNSVSFSLAETVKGTMSDGSEAVQQFKITNVPAQRNWRTNILGGTGTDNSIFDPHIVTLWVDIVPGYDGEHNTNNGGKWTSAENELDTENE